MKRIRISFLTATVLLSSVLLLNAFSPISMPLVYEARRSGEDFAVFHFNREGKVTEYFKVQHCTWDVSETSILHVEYAESTLTLIGANGIRYVFTTKPESVSAEESSRLFTEIAGVGHFELTDGSAWDLQKMEAHAFGK
ncbi:MAG: hypothetical protein JNM22_01455 [Saprospiraceae bacterium]|nr:hypothetical protein [Saprospiraceae bacterium]